MFGPNLYNSLMCILIARAHKTFYWYIILLNLLFDQCLTKSHDPELKLKLRRSSFMHILLEIIFCLICQVMSKNIQNRSKIIDALKTAPMSEYFVYFIMQWVLIGVTWYMQTNWSYDIIVYCLIYPDFFQAPIWLGEPIFPKQLIIGAVLRATVY